MENPFLNFEEIKDKLFIKVMNKNANKELLDNKDIIRKDLAIAGEGADIIYTYNLLIPNDDINAITSVPITEYMFEQYQKDTGITESEFNELALENSAKICPFRIGKMMDVLNSLAGDNKDMLYEEGNVPFYVITTEPSVNGATAIFYPNIKQSVSKMLGDDFYIIPSSIQEVIVIPYIESLDIRIAENVIKSINGTLHPSEILSDKLLHYDKKLEKIETAEEFKKRTEKEISR